MARIAVAAALLLSGMTTHGASAQEIDTAAECTNDAGCTEQPQMLDDARQAASDAGVDLHDLLGALNTLAAAGTPMTARAYLCTSDGVLCPDPPPVAACGWPICGSLGQRLFCIESIESHHGLAMYNRTPVWDGEHAQGWLGFLPSTARAWGVAIGDRVSEWLGAARMLGSGAGRQFFGIAAGIC